MRILNTDNLITECEMGAVKRFFRNILKLVPSLNSFYKLIRRKLLALLLSFVRAVPIVKILVRNITRAFPLINSYLLGFASAHPQQQNMQTAKQKSTMPSSNYGIELSKISSLMLNNTLPKGQRRIYYYVDHTVCCPVNTGMQRVVRELAKSLLDSGEKLYFVKWDFAVNQLILINREELDYLFCWKGSSLAQRDEVGYPEKDGLNVVIPKHFQGEANWLLIPEVTHINYHPVPVTLNIIMSAKLLGLKSAFIFYDATPLRRKELASIATNHANYMQHLLLADLLLPISGWSASDLASFFTHDELASPNTMPTIVSISLPGEMQTYPRAVSKNQFTNQTILSIGSITEHKNQLSLARAFENFSLRYPNDGWELILVGNIHPDLVSELTSITNRTPSIKVIYNLTDPELNNLLTQCAFTIFPSIMEGFGLPILESLWHGKPCICANFGAMAEVAAGGGCLMVDVRSSNTILSAIECLVFEPDTLLRLQDEALARPLKKWSDYANNVSEALNQASDPLKKVGLVYFLVANICSDAFNTLTQQSTISIASALIRMGVRLIPTMWDQTDQSLRPLNHQEIINLSRFNELAIEGWAEWQDPAMSSLSDWLFIPEVLMGSSEPTASFIKRSASNFRMRTVCMFFDSKLWLNADADYDFNHAYFEKYMRGLNEFDLILPISEQGRDELLKFLQSVPDRTPNLEDRLRFCGLPEKDVIKSTDKNTTESIDIKDFWTFFAKHMVFIMANERQIPVEKSLIPILPLAEFKNAFINLPSRPILSICISTYNRAAWLAVSLENLRQLIPVFQYDVEIVVCDNASTDNSVEVIKPYLDRNDFRFYRNKSNVGMLGNLQVTAHNARGRHVWILGDDDLVKRGSIERVLKVLREHPDLALVYLNYSYTREDDATAIKDIDCFLDDATPVVQPSSDVTGPVWRISTESENFFTAIYCLVLRRDHALHAYSKNTAGRPFSTMLTCIPTTFHVLNYMMDEDAYWIGEPLLVVNLNVSWMKYASIWILERLPEVFDIAEKLGADKVALDKIRSEHLRHIHRWFNEIYINDEELNIEYFNPVRLFARFKHLEAFDKALPGFRAIYEEAHFRNAKGANLPWETVFSVFNK